MFHFPFYIQYNSTDCGITCLRMIAKYYGKKISLHYLQKITNITREGVSIFNICETANEIGIKTVVLPLNYEQLLTKVPLPCIVHWNQDHFVVVYKITGRKAYVADPAVGLISYRKNDFIEKWMTTNHCNDKGIAILLEPTDIFFSLKEEKDEKKFFFLKQNIILFKKQFFIILLGLIVSSGIQLLFPFLTQSIVDIGIKNKDIGFIYLILLAQITLFFSRMSVDYVRSWFLLHISTRINISLVSDFIAKLMKLPLKYFENSMTGDIVQRIYDHNRLEQFFTSQTLDIIFSTFNFIVFSIVLAVYNKFILIVFVVGSIVYFIWIFFFIHKRKVLDFRHFEQQADSSNVILQIISGMPEIKLNQCENQKTGEWEIVQLKKYRVDIKRLSLNQYQNTGSVVINETKNIVITILSAMAVIDGSMTLGMMLAIQYIIGQLNGPIAQLTSFIYLFQDAKISIERLNDVHRRQNEEIDTDKKLHEFNNSPNINIKNLVFQYEGSKSKKVINDISITLPYGKTTAIVGQSGSGKTTLLKLLLGFYRPSQGEILIGDNSLSDYDLTSYRSRIGTVLQDGYIFSDTILRNIALGAESIDIKKIEHAAFVANIKSSIEELPLGYNTKIGQNGVGLSKGQIQRLLIARAVYKDPEFIFFDEATNSLDADNERIIVDNLRTFFKGKTVIIIAHRLSTVKDADKILVLNKGMISESGSHTDLVSKKGEYYQLVKNQLELGT